MKRSLPTLHDGRGGGRGRSGRSGGGGRGGRPIAPRERKDPPLPLLSLGYANQAREAGRFSLQLTAALSKRGLKVAALVAAHGSEPVSEVAVTDFLEAGAGAARRIQVPAQGGLELLSDALAELSEAEFDLVIGIGNALPEYYQPFFSVALSGHRRQRIPDDPQLLRADLEITTPSDQLADELARMLQARLPAARPSGAARE